jgi:predicted nucleic acid-binding protein
MTFADLVRGASLFVDANTLVFQTIAPPLVDAAAGISQSTGLLTNDAMVVAVMRANGLTNLASNDGDFDHVPGLARYAPA